MLLGWLALGQVTPIDTKTWVAFGLIAVGAALAQLFPVVTPRDQSYHMTMVVLVPAALLLPTWLLPAVVVAQHVPEWLKVRYPWYIQTFNASNYLLDLFAAGAVGRYVLEQDGLITNDEVRFAVAGLAAAVVLVLLNHAILAVMLRLGRGHSLRESGLFSFENLSTELVLAALGVLVAFAWTINPALIPFAVAPLLLFHRSLAVPQLEQEARLDPKTGLFNVRHFSTVLNDKLEHSLRTGEPLALLMIDLDLLREINNTYGHLAGDAVLVRVADVFRNSLRADDIAARFGGEEFVVLLPDTEFEDALALAERIRADDRPPAGQRGGDRRDAVGDGLDRHRDVPARRLGYELTHPQRRPRRVPRQDPGAQPCRRRARRAARRAPAELRVVGAEAEARSRSGAATRGGALVRCAAAAPPVLDLPDERSSTGRDIALQVSSRRSC